jgi:hypothetical protein
MAFDYRSDPVLARVLAYWCERRRGRSMPARRDIDPADLAPLLPHLQLIDVLAGDRFRYRLVGTELVQAFGRDYTGEHVDELFRGARSDFVASVFRKVRDGRRPLFLRARYSTVKNLDLLANRLYMPLSEDDHTVNMILGALTFRVGGDEPLLGAWGSARLDAAGSEMVLIDPDSVADIAPIG